MDPALRTTVAKSLEFAVNRTLAYDPGSQAALAHLAGKSLAVRFTQPALSLYFDFVDERVRVAGYREMPADCTLTGSLPAVLGLLWREHHSLADSGVNVMGDVGVLQQLQRILTELDLDWEQALGEATAGITGPANAELLTHPLAQFLRGRGHWLRRQANTMPDWLRDYVTEEMRLLPSPHEITAFSQDVDDVRAAVDRLEARLRKLRQTLDTKSFIRD